MYIAGTVVAVAEVDEPAPRPPAGGRCALRHLRLDLGERGVGVVVELQVHGDGAHALGARRLDVVDAVGAGDHALQRRGAEAAHQVGVGAHIAVVTSPPQYHLRGYCRTLSDGSTGVRRSG